MKVERPWRFLFALFLEELDETRLSTITEIIIWFGIYLVGYVKSGLLSSYFFGLGYFGRYFFPDTHTIGKRTTEVEVLLGAMTWVNKSKTQTSRWPYPITRYHHARKCCLIFSNEDRWRYYTEILIKYNRLLLNRSISVL